MNYLLDKKAKRNKYLKLAISATALLILIYFQSGIFSGFSAIAQFIFRPVLIFGNGVGNRLQVFGAYFSSKKSLSVQNEKLRAEMIFTKSSIANYDSVLEENNKLKEILGRKKEQADLILAGILAKPNQSAYDTLLIDVGGNSGIKSGDMVFAFGNIPIGRVDLVHANSAKVILFSSPGEKTRVILPLGRSLAGEASSDIFAEAVGRGGGNFEILLPRDIVLEKGMEITLPGVNNHLLGTVEGVISDPRDSFQKILLVSPVNIQELKFVEIEIQK